MRAWDDTHAVSSLIVSDLHSVSSFFGLGAKVGGGVAALRSAASAIALAKDEPRA
jgi:hypothetical protein